jgi:hypothetical protein
MKDRGQLPEPQCAPRRKQHHQPVPVWQRCDDSFQLGKRRRFYLVYPLLLPAPRMWQGFDGMRSSVTALPKMLRSKL